jgi:hypothetical protein
VRWPVALLLACFAALDAACGSGSAERQLLTNFFRAARLHDNTVLANIATVTFNPRTEGTVENFEVVSVASDPRGKTVTVNARVRTPDGQTVPRTIVFTLERASEGGDGRWLITGLQQPS